MANCQLRLSVLYGTMQVHYVQHKLYSHKWMQYPKAQTDIVRLFILKAIKLEIQSNFIGAMP